MTPYPRNLTVAPEPTPRRNATRGRVAIADRLRQAASIVERNVGNNVAAWPCGLEVDPSAAVVITLISADGEPSVMHTGLADLDLDTRLELASDICQAVRMTLTPEHFRVRARTADEVPTIQQLIHDRWERTEENRHIHRAAEEAKRAEHEQSHPYLCDCGQRCKSQGGLANHQRSCRTNRKASV